MSPFAVRFREPDGSRAAGELAVDADFAVDGPLVSCLMVSRGRSFPAAHAIAAFQRQTYRNRELLIVCAEPAHELASLIERLDDNRIRFLPVAPASLGDLRNRAVAHASGELLCQWDDDDLSAPDRIALQVATLAADRVQACFLDRVTLWSGAEHRLALSGVRIWENTMLVWRAAQPIYPALGLREDTAVAQMIIDRHRVALLHAPHAYLYVRHGANVSGSDHFDALFAAAEPAGASLWAEDSALLSYLGDGKRIATEGPKGKLS